MKFIHLFRNILMKINPLIFFLGFLWCQLSFGLPTNFYKNESNARFIKTKYNDYYTIEKYNSDLVQVYEKKSNNNFLIEKYEAKFINPIDGNYSYNNFYQINKNYFYENGKINKTSYEIGKMDNCFVKCGAEFFYKNSKIYKKNEYPNCLSLFNIETRQLDYKNSYVKKNCIPN